MSLFGSSSAPAASRSCYDDVYDVKHDLDAIAKLSKQLSGVASKLVTGVVAAVWKAIKLVVS